MEDIHRLIQQRRCEQREPICAYIYDLSRLRCHVSRVMATLPAPCRMFYAIKANSEEPILRALAPLVSGFEVASLGEIEKVRAIDPDIPILFGGPGKTDEEMAGAIRHRVGLVHVESLHELQRLERVAARLETVVPILLRVNLRGPLPAATLQMAGTPTQFGIDEGEVAEAVALARRLPYLRLRGFHLHCISNHLDAQGHAELIRHYLQLVQGWARAWRLPVSYVNVGGGIGVNYHDLDQQFEWDCFTARLREQLPAICPPEWQILFECGRYLTAACGYYATEVLDIKENHGEGFLVVRGGTHHFRLPVSWQHSHPFSVVPIERWPYPFPRPQLTGRAATVVGQLCTPKDVLARDVPIERVRAGDVLLFRYTGAYGWAISHHDFLSHPHPDHLYLT